MRIKHKYLRNRLFKHKCWHKAKSIVGGEFSYKTLFPYWRYGFISQPWEEQLKEHQESIRKQAMSFESGDKPWHKSPKWFRKPYNRKERRIVNNILTRMTKGDILLEIPKFVYNADWDWT